MESGGNISQGFESSQRARAIGIKRKGSEALRAIDDVARGLRGSTRRELALSVNYQW
jgi:hypothetical protein